MISWNLDHFELDENTKRLLKSKYPQFETELIKMEMWYIANPKKQKKNHMRFMVNWLNKTLTAPVLTKHDFQKKEDQAFKEKWAKAMQEYAPPPKEWKEMLAKLKRGVA